MTEVVTLIVEVRLDVVGCELVDVDTADCTDGLDVTEMTGDSVDDAAVLVEVGISLESCMLLEGKLDGDIVFAAIVESVPISGTPCGN